MQTILSFHELAQLLFKFIIKLLLPTFLKKKLISSAATIHLSVYSLHTRNVSFFRMAQACEGHVPRNMDLACKRVSKLLIKWYHHFQRLT